MLSNDTSEITLMLSDLVKVVNKMQKEQDRNPLNPKGAYITIYTKKDIESGKQKKSARFDILELSGLGCISIDSIDELSEEELLNIP